MFMKKPSHRVFDYPPRFYNPLKDEEEKKKKRLGFRSYRRQTKKKGSLIGTILLFVLILIAIYFWGK